MLYERRMQRLVPWRVFLVRASRHLFWALVMLGGAVGIGTYGYHATARLGWLDASLNASMILSGMGPVDRLDSSAAKVFASLYALFSGLVFLGIAGVVVAPWIHRLFHWIHLDDPSP